MNMQEAVETELEKLCSLGAIEPVEAMEWLSPIVAQKSCGRIGLCVDLRALNKEVVTDKFPLSNIRR